MHIHQTHYNSTCAPSDSCRLWENDCENAVQRMEKMRIDLDLGESNKPKCHLFSVLWMLDFLSCPRNMFLLLIGVFCVCVDNGWVEILKSGDWHRTTFLQILYNLHDFTIETLVVSDTHPHWKANKIQIAPIPHQPITTERTEWEENSSETRSVI